MSGVSIICYNTNVEVVMAGGFGGLCSTGLITCTSVVAMASPLPSLVGRGQVAVYGAVKTEKNGF